MRSSVRAEARSRGCDHAMNLPEPTLPEHLRDDQGLPRSRTERLMLIRRRIDQGYYESERIRLAVAEAFLEPQQERRAGDQAFPSG